MGNQASALAPDPESSLYGSGRLVLGSFFVRRGSTSSICGLFPGGACRALTTTQMTAVRQGANGQNRRAAPITRNRFGRPSRKEPSIGKNQRRRCATKRKRNRKPKEASSSVDVSTRRPTSLEASVRGRELLGVFLFFYFLFFYLLGFELSKLRRQGGKRK